MDTVNDVAGRLRTLIESLYIDDKYCGYCLLADSKYDGKCRAFSWDITFYPDDEKGTWSFSLNYHTKEILFSRTHGSIVEALMDAYGKVTEFKLTYNNRLPIKPKDGIFDSKWVTIIQYSDFDKLVRKHYNKPDYEVLIGLECGNDTEHLFHVKKEPIDEYDMDSKRFFEYPQTILNDLCNKEIIEEGEYLIQVCW